MTKAFDFIVIGAGLAGLSLTKELMRRGYLVGLVEKDKVAAGASGCPIGLANYATGRHAKMSWQSEACLDHLLKNLNEVQQQSAVHFYTQNGVIRPALDEDISTKMKANYDETDWPENFAEWVSPEGIKEMNPYLFREFGGVWLPKALTVNIPLYLKSMKRILDLAGLETMKGDIAFQHEQDSVFVFNAKHDKWVARKLIITSGVQSSTFKVFQDLPLHPIKGQLLVMKSKEAIPFEHSISALGYIGRLDSHHFAVGSTYEHHFEDLKPTDEGKERLENKLFRVIPSLMDETEILQHWSNVRASTPNRMPIAGRHPEYESVYTFSGLGSKGLLFSAYISYLMADLLIDQLPLPHEIDLIRFQ